MPGQWVLPKHSQGLQILQDNGRYGSKEIYAHLQLHSNYNSKTVNRQYSSRNNSNIMENIGVYIVLYSIHRLRPWERTLASFYSSFLSEKLGNIVFKYNLSGHLPALHYDCIPLCPTHKLRAQIISNWFPNVRIGNYCNQITSTVTVWSFCKASWDCWWQLIQLILQRKIL